MKNQYDLEKEKSSENTHKLHENSFRKIWGMKNLDMTKKKEKSFENTHKLHKNS